MYVPELQETKVEPLPAASLDTLKSLREEMCSQSSSRDFKLQSHQRFLRRILSPDAPTRSLLMVHGTGTGKTCSAIQIAEEYIIRPEFQESKVLVVCQPAVQRNFRKQIFDDSKVHVDPDGLVLSKQCTGRRYLDMLQRTQREPLKWSSRQVREKMIDIVKKIVDEFYEFKGYIELYNRMEEQQKLGNEEHVTNWIHKTYDNRMIIIDEAHNLKVSTDATTSKLVSMALERIVQTAHNVTLILLTATPMYDSYTEIVYYFNLFLWNDRKQSAKKQLTPSKVFTPTGEFQPGMETQFRSWCQEYVSYIKGDNPLTFPFRLPPPDSMIAPISTNDYLGNPIPSKQRRRYLTLTKSVLEGVQLDIVKTLKIVGGNPPPELVCVLPDGKPLSSVFVTKESGVDYAPGIPAFLSPSQVSKYSSKFALVMKTIEQSTGMIFVYTNLIGLGSNLFAMCLEEHGYQNAADRQFLAKTTVQRGTKGKFVVFSGETTDSEIEKMISRCKRRENMNGSDIKIIIGTKRVAEGLDFSFIRQVHALDYWWNMSRIEQVVGRGIRTCSHQLLPFEQQNCTVYLHCCTYPDSDRETLDEFYYRTLVEGKAAGIAKIKNIIMESAMDCPLQQEINRLPQSWRDLEITQIRSQDSKEVILTLSQLASPIFGEEAGSCKVVEKDVNSEHERPLSSYLDVRDELFDKLISMFYRKPVWLKKDLMASEELVGYDPNVVIYLLHNAIETGLILKNKYGQKGFLASRKNYYVFNITDTDVVQDLYTDTHEETVLPFSKLTKEKVIKTTEIDISKVKWDFSPEVKTWYIVDQVLTKDERLHHMINLDWDDPPFYAKGLILDKSTRILGSKEFYQGKKKVTLLGDDFDKYTKWVIGRKNAYVAAKNTISATAKNGLLFNLDDKADKMKLAERTNAFGGRNCNSFKKPLVTEFAEWLDGRGFPKTPKELTKTEQCQYLSLLVRDAILKGKEGITWWTPEEMEIFNEDVNRKDLLLRLK
jgi:superfamily II DNA or RNA helicase